MHFLNIKNSYCLRTESGEYLPEYSARTLVLQTGSGDSLKGILYIVKI